MRGRRPFQEGRARSILISLLGTVAVATLAVLAWSLATRKSVVDQLVDVLCGEDQPDAVWAFETLKEIPQRDVHDLVRYVDDERPTLLHQISTAKGNMDMTLSREGLPLGRVCRCALQSRIGGLHRLMLFSYGEGENAEEIGKVVEEWLRKYPEPDGSRRFWWWGVQAPSRHSALRRIADARDAGGLLDLLSGDDVPAAHWAFEVLRSLPDACLDPVVPRLRKEAPTPIHVLRCAWPRGPIAAGEDRIGLTALLAVVLTERAGSEGAQQLMAVDPLRPTGETLAAIESAWKAHRDASSAPQAQR